MEILAYVMPMVLRVSFYMKRQIMAARIENNRAVILESSIKRAAHDIKCKPIARRPQITFIHRVTWRQFF